MIIISFLQLLCCGIVICKENFLKSACEYQATDGTCYGEQLKQKSFLLADGFTNLNHGSFGTVPRPVSLQQHNYFMEQEAHPDDWFRVNYYDYIDRSRQSIADLIAADVDDVVLVENASSAVNSILRSLGLQRGDKVLRLSTAYGMVAETLDWLAETSGIQVIVAEVDFPVTSSAQFLTAVRNALEQHPDLKMCIFSHISSMPAIIEPIGELIHLVRSNNPRTLVLIDGAHAPGVLKLDVPSLQADYYLGNCHKWLYAPKGTAFLWVTPSQQQPHAPEPTVISSSGNHDFIGRYAYTGTRDYTHFATIPAALDFRSYLGGGDQIYEYCHGLAVAAARLLSTAWKTELLVAEELSGFMVNVILPSRDADAVAYMQQELNSTYNIYLVYSSATITVGNQTFAHEGSSSVQTSESTVVAEETVYFTRLSAQVYLSLEDFMPLTSLVPQLLKDGEKH